jgi:DNA-binding NarL/FixJ family response regulator
MANPDVLPASWRGYAPRLGGRATLYLQASVIVSFLAASSAPTPLYAVYQQQWHFPAITTTVVFGVYAVSVLAALLVVGSLSDHVGRKPVIVSALAAEAAVMLFFAHVDGAPELLAARILQGLATGAVLNAAGAAMIDVDRSRGTLANAASPGLGTGTGALVSGLFVQYLPARTELVYEVLAGVLVAQAVLALLMPETVSRKPGALASLGTDLALPPVLRGPLVRVAPVLVAVWALAGYDVIDRAGDALSLIEAVRTGLPDLVIADIRMPPTHTSEGIDAARTIRGEFPRIGVLLLSAHVDLETTIDFLHNGERIGYLLKSRIMKVENLIDALERIALGDAVIDPVLVKELLAQQRRTDPLAVLTARERDVLALVAEGRSNGGIAQRLWVSEGAVEKHVRSILAKLKLPASNDDHRRVLAVLMFLEGN